MKLDKKGFTVIELILSFTLVMFLAIAMFALVNNYRDREQKEAIKRELLSLKSTLTSDIYQDTIARKVKNMKYCNDTSSDNNKQCIRIYFADGMDKELKIVKEKVEVDDEEESFAYDSFYILYGGVKYNNPDPKFTEVVDDYILTYTTESDSLEYGVIYKINIRLKHQDIDDEYVINIVTTGLEL